MINSPDEIAAEVRALRPSILRNQSKEPRGVMLGENHSLEFRRKPYWFNFVFTTVTPRDLMHVYLHSDDVKDEFNGYFQIAEARRLYNRLLKLDFAVVK